MTPNLIGIYHKGCTDGTTAAAVLLKKFPEIKLFPLDHAAKPEDLEPIYKEINVDPKNTKLYIVDGAFNLEAFLTKYTDMPITVIDHHIGTKELLENTAKVNKQLTFLFNNDKSGASLTWEYFFPDTAMPEIIKLVEDFDLWKWKYGEDTKDVVGYLYMFANKPEESLQFFDHPLTDIKARGKIIASYSDFLISRFTRHPDEHLTLKVGPHMVPAYNIPVFQSECGNLLSVHLKGQPVILYDIRGEQVKFSIRSEASEGPNALDIATLLGGGGHEKAAGAVIGFKQFLGLIQ